MKLNNINIYKTVFSKLKEKGIVHYMRIFYKKFFEIINPKYRKLCIFELDLAQFSGKSNQRKDVRVEITKSIDEIVSFIKEREDWYYAYAEELFEKGNLCFVGKIDNKIVSCVWTSFNEVYLSDVEYLLYVDKYMVPLIDGYTLPEYRNMGIYSAVWHSCVKYFHNKPKYTKIYGFITPSNMRSLLVHKKLTLERIIMKITLLRVFGIRKHFIKHIIQN